MGVNWDQATQTIQLGNTTAGVDLIDTYKAYFLTDKVNITALQRQTAGGETMEISGIPCSHWMCLQFYRIADQNSLCTGSFNVGQVQLCDLPVLRQ